MEKNLDKWLEEMKAKVENNKLIWRNADTSQNIFYLQQQIAIANEIELKKIELQYLNKGFPNHVLFPLVPPKYNKNGYNIQIT